MGRTDYVTGKYGFHEETSSHITAWVVYEVGKSNPVCGRSSPAGINAFIVNIHSVANPVVPASGSKSIAETASMLQDGLPVQLTSNSQVQDRVNGIQGPETWPSYGFHARYV